jgi:hypothetical protein
MSGKHGYSGNFSFDRDRHGTGSRLRSVMWITVPVF